MHHYDITPHQSHPNLDLTQREGRQRLALVKFELLQMGCRIAEPAEHPVRTRKPAIRTRSGVSGGLDIVIPPAVHVNCDVAESRALNSPYVIDWSEGQFYLRRDGDGLCIAIEVPAQPEYYGARTSDGTPMVKVGQMCSTDRICIGVSSTCHFWPKDRRCRFCSIGANTQREAPTKSIQSIVETVYAASHDPVLPARHVLLGGGTPPGDDRGALFAAEACRAIKTKCDLPVYVMIVPPSRLDYLDLLKDAGVDEIGMNVELFDPTELQRYAPGKYHEVGHEYYYTALEYAVRKFGSVNTRSIAVVGLEPPANTAEGMRRLADMGVMPILSPFKALDGADLASAQGFEAQVYVDLFEQCQAICEAHGLTLGPTCIACQNNVLALPFGDSYRYY